MNMSLLLITLFIIKHFICDFLMQNSYQYLNKGTYGHPGGILHAGITLFGTIKSITIAWLFAFFIAGTSFNPSLFIILYVLVVEVIIHYHVDWAKMNVCKYKNWKPDTSERFWHLLGFDQLIHYLTYVWMVWMLV